MSRLGLAALVNIDFCINIYENIFEEFTASVIMHLDVYYMAHEEFDVFNSNFDFKYNVLFNFDEFILYPSSSHRLLKVLIIVFVAWT